MKSQIHKFLNIEIVKNVSVLSIGTIGSQLIPLLFAPIIARLYSPNEFGLFAFVLGGVNIAAVVINGRYDLSVVLPRNQSQAIDLVKGSWIIGFTLSALFTLILLLTRKDLAEFLDYQISIIECIILGLIVSNIAISQPLNFYLIREKAFAQIAKNKIVKGAVLVLMTLLFGYLMLDLPLNGLVYGFGFSWAALAIFSLYQSVKLSFSVLPINLSKIKVALKEYIEYPKFNAVPALFNSIAAQLGIYIFMFHFDQTQTGYYTFSKQYVFVPMTIVGMSLSQVIFQRISEKFNNRESVIKELKILFLVLISLGGIIILIINLFSVELFGFFFGDQWLDSAIMVKTLVFYFAIQFIISPLSNVLHALKRVKLAAVFPVFYLLCMLTLFCIPAMNTQRFITLYTIVESVPYLLYFVLISYATFSYERQLKS